MSYLLAFSLFYNTYCHKPLAQVQFLEDVVVIKDCEAVVTTEVPCDVPGGLERGLL